MLGLLRYFWANYSDLTRSISPKWRVSKGNPLFPVGEIIWPDFRCVASRIEFWAQPDVFGSFVWSTSRNSQHMRGKDLEKHDPCE